MSKFSAEAFRVACGDLGSVGLLAENPGRPGTRFSFLHQPYAIIGREKSRDLILDDQNVSRRHAYVQILNGDVFCVDLKSWHGTHWRDGTRFAGWLSPITAVRMGGSTLRLVDESPVARPLQTFNPLEAGCLEKPFVTLEFLDDPTRPPEWPVDRLLTLMGRSSSCKLRFANPDVASVHASLVCTGDGAWVVDLHTTLGVVLNGQRVRLARLEDKDELRIGNFAMRVHCQPVTSLALRPTPPAVQFGAAQNADTKHAQMTTVDFGPSAREIAFESARTNSQGLERLGDPATKAMLDSVFLPMVQQFSAVQNQMFDQFQQSMAMMFQMFGTLQKDQIDFLRAELDRVQHLTREIQTLQSEMKAPVGGARGLGVPKFPLFGESRSNGTSPRMPVAKRDGQTEGAPAHESPALNQPNQTRQAVNPVENPAAENAQQNGPDIHALLCERMTELQEDRRSRMQKMVDFLAGK